jgi:hypothetical protein
MELVARFVEGDEVMCWMCCESRMTQFNAMLSSCYCTDLDVRVSAQSRIVLRDKNFQGKIQNLIFFQSCILEKVRDWIGRTEASDSRLD